MNYGYQTLPEIAYIYNDEKYTPFTLLYTRLFTDLFTSPYTYKFAYKCVYFQTHEQKRLQN